MSSVVHVDVWSDVVCPWCYVGKRHLEQAIGEFGSDKVSVTYHSFQLDPSAEQIATESTPEHLAKKYGIPVQEALAMMQGVAERAATVGLEYHLEEAVGGNTFDAHRLLHFALTQGKQAALKEALMHAHFTETKSPGDHEVLVDVAVSVGLNEARVREILSSNEFAVDVEQDIAQARAFNITGVPFFVVDGKYGISGAQPSSVMLAALTKASEDAQELMG